jgi:NAD(P)-dependent dehydrogenase (short-subunit alcohol dehydrogenase family)
VSVGFSLAGKRAIVTGASRGIGREIAKALAAAGAAVAVSARKREDLGEVQRDIQAQGRLAVLVSLDVRVVDDCRAGVSEAARKLGGLDILINNAGYEEVRPSLEVEEGHWDAIVDTNLKGAFFVAQAAAREMKDRGGAIVNVCSLTSYVGVPTAAPYTSSKAGLLGMTRALASEWAPLNIRVNAIAPGYFQTAMTAPFYESDEWRNTMIRKIPQGRFGELADLAGAAVFLASDASNYITGQCLPIDGGYLASI